MTALFKLSINKKHIDSAPPIICITGTSTGIGKTVFTGLLAQEVGKKKSVVTQKWVQSGDLDAPDIHTHDRLSLARIDSKWSVDRQVYSFKTAVSPHLAAKLENTDIQPEQLKNATQRLSDAFDVVLIETSGGIMVPIQGVVTTGDIVSEMEVPTIVVIPNVLGCINHALLTLDYLIQKNIPILGFIMNQFDGGVSEMHRDNPAIITKISGVQQIGEITPSII